MAYIPKRICYCWFGGEKPWIVQQCIESWHRVLGDYEITEINESNIDVGHPFIRKCLQTKRYAYLSDLARLLWLKDNPGIYLDTDMYFLRPIPEYLLYNEVFLGVQSRIHVALGVLGIASVDNEFVLDCIKVYDNLQKPDANTHLISDMLRRKYDLETLNFKSQKGVSRFHDITILGREYFYPITNRILFTENTAAIHLYMGSSCSRDISRDLYIDNELRISDYLQKNFPDEWDYDLKKIISYMKQGREVYSTR